METRTYKILNADGTEKETIVLTGKESEKTTTFVTKYDSYEGYPWEKESYGTISPDAAFVSGMISAADAMAAETAELRVLVKYEQDAVDVRAEEGLVGFCQENN